MHKTILNSYHVGPMKLLSTGCSLTNNSMCLTSKNRTKHGLNRIFNHDPPENQITMPKYKNYKEMKNRLFDITINHGP